MFNARMKGSGKERVWQTSADLSPQQRYEADDGGELTES